MTTKNNLFIHISLGVSVLLSILVSSCHRVPAKTDEKVDVQISSIECDEELYAPVIGEDKKCYLNTCRALKKGVKIKSDSYDDKNFDKANFYTWPIEQVCKPRNESWDTIPPQDLNDGTFIYVNQKQNKFRGTRNTCRCLSASTRIDTPNGEVLITEIHKGDSIYTLDLNGNKIVAVVELTNTQAVPSNYSMISIELEDGRSVTGSAGHPIHHLFRTFGQLTIGEEFNGSKITAITSVQYQEGKTYDILPAGELGVYWANGVLIRSTLKENNYIEELLRMGW